MSELFEQRFLTAEITGDVEIDRALNELIDAYGDKGINEYLRKGVKLAVKEIIEPEVRSLIPHRFGTLESMLVVRATPRSRNKVGYFVGFNDGSRPGTQSGSHYGWYIEFGWDHRLGVKVEPDSYLRRALYPNEEKVIAKVKQFLEDWIQQANSKDVPDG